MANNELVAFVNSILKSVPKEYSIVQGGTATNPLLWLTIPYRRVVENSMLYSVTIHWKTLQTTLQEVSMGNTISDETPL